MGQSQFHIINVQRRLADLMSQVRILLHEILQTAVTRVVARFLAKESYTISFLDVGNTCSHLLDKTNPLVPWKNQ